MKIELDDLDLDRLGAAIARHLSAPADVEMLDLPAASKLSGVSAQALKEACRVYEAGNDDGLRCSRVTPGVSNSTFQVKRAWLLEWQERQADLNRKREPIRLGRAAA